MACGDEEIDLCEIPLVALNVTVRKMLGLRLNPTNTVAADWMAVAEAMGFSFLEIQNYEMLENPTKKLLGDWQAASGDATVGNLLKILEKLERKDILEDLRPYIGAFTLIWKS